MNRTPEEAKKLVAGPLGVMNRTQAVYAVNRLGIALPSADEVCRRAIETTSATNRVISLLGRQSGLQPA